MFQVLSITGVIYLMVALGYLAVKTKIFAPGDMRVFGTYVITFALPALIFRGMVGKPLTEILHADYMLIYLIAGVASFFTGFAISRFSGEATTAAAIRGMGWACPNSGYFGYPIMLMAMPTIAPLALTMNMTVENLVLVPLGLICAEIGAGGASGWRLARQVALRIMRNPIVLGIVAGLLAASTGLEPPPVAAKVIDLIAQSAAAISLLVVGGALASLTAADRDARVIPVVLGKLFVHPLYAGLAVWGAAALGTPIGDPVLGKALILTAAMPALGIYPIVAQRFGYQNQAAMALLAMTAFSFPTVTLLMAILEIG